MLNCSTDNDLVVYVQVAVSLNRLLGLEIARQNTLFNYFRYMQ
jgi:hypothetical protein